MQYVIAAAIGLTALVALGDTAGAGTRPAPPFLVQAYLQATARTLDGSYNNLRDPGRGQMNTPYSRIAPPNYADGKSAMVSGPDPRYISNRIFNDKAQNIFSENGVTQWAFVWGQFLDHSFGLAQGGGTPGSITFNSSDPLEDFRNDLGGMLFQRDAAAPGTGVTTPMQQVNTVSSYIDAWAVYGGTKDRLEWLRAGPVDGNLSNNSALMLTTPDGYLPKTTARGNVATAPAMNLMGPLTGAPQNAIVAGDVRANENIGLTAVQTLFVREHNRIVGQLPAGWPEQLKFEVARRIVGAEEQYITYNEFLPAMGVRLPAYRGYNPAMNANLSNEFATVGYRAHSMIHGEIEVEGEPGDFTHQQLDALETQGLEIQPEGSGVKVVVPLNVGLGNPALVPQLGLDKILAGLASESEYRNDEQIDNQLRSVMFQIPKPGIPDPGVCLDGTSLPDCYTTVMDLAALDIQRGRDHGMPGYNDMRAAYGLPRKTSFTAITGESTDAFPNDPLIDKTDPIDDPNILDFTQLFDRDGNPVTPGTDAAENSVTRAVRRTTVAARLKAIYGSVDNIDAFVGMASEKHLPGTEFGELQQRMWARQFTALRDGDRFFYASDPALPMISRYLGVDYEHTLSEIIALNSGASDLPADVFHVPATAAATTGAPGASAAPCSGANSAVSVPGAAPACEDPRRSRVA